MARKSLKFQTKFSMAADFFTRRKKEMSTWKKKTEGDYRADFLFLPASFFSSSLDTLMLVIPNI
jgi:hypothetical protein